MVSPHKVYGPERNDLSLPLRKRGTRRVILAGKIVTGVFVRVVVNRMIIVSPNVELRPLRKRVVEGWWLVTFMHSDLGYLDDQTCRLEPIDNPFGPKLLPMSPE